VLAELEPVDELAEPDEVEEPDAVGELERAAVDELPAAAVPDPEELTALEALVVPPPETVSPT
jgi:hypothetical protein